MKIIKSVCGQDIFVDDKFYYLFSNYTWRINKRGYAERKSGKKRYLMHREVVGLEIGEDAQVDHKDLNKLNNQSSNLRIATQSENMINRAKYDGEFTSKYKGVHYCNRAKKWIAKIMIEKKNVYIGSYANEELAGEAYNNKAIELFGEFATLNTVDLSLVKPTDIKYKGVYFHSRDNKWVANGKINGKVHHLGYFSTQKEALGARNNWAKDNGKPTQEWRDINEKC